MKSFFKGSKGFIKTYSIEFDFFPYKFAVSISETKWHKGEKYKRIPIWFDKIRGEVPAVFVNKVAFLIQRKQKSVTKRKGAIK